MKGCILTVGIIFILFSCSERENEISEKPEAELAIENTDSTSTRVNQVMHYMDRLDDGIDYLGEYYEDQQKVYLDSATAIFDEVQLVLQEPLLCVNMGSTCELIGEEALAINYYQKGRELNSKLFKEKSRIDSTMYALNEVTFQFLLKETNDIQELIRLYSSEVKWANYYSVDFTKNTTRQEVLETFSF